LKQPGHEAINQEGINMQRNSERSNPRFKARFPRLDFLRRRRREEESPWYSTADGDGMVTIRPRHRH